MSRWVARAPFMLAGLFALAACSQFANLMPTGTRNSGPAATTNGCYVIKQAPQNVMATITFYGWPDNTPPGKRIAHPIIHKRAGGDGTYCNPTTFATEPSNDKSIPYGIKIYVPFLKQYFIREDDCTASGPPVGSGSNGCTNLWFDLWVGGNAKSKTRAVVACERQLTPNLPVSVILYPDAGMPVSFPGPLYGNDPPPNGTCDGNPER